MKKTLAMIMVICLLLSGCSFAEMNLATLNSVLNYPVTDKPMDVTIGIIPQGGAVDFKPENNWMCQYMELYSGLNITWQVIDPNTASERVTMMLNTGDLPDALIGEWFNTDDIVQYGVSEGLFYPINEIMDELPIFSAYLEKTPAVKSAITAPDGNIYGFPKGVGASDDNFDQRFFYNQKWLDNLGLEVPETLEDFKNMLIAFRDEDANGNGDPSDELTWEGAWSDGDKESIFILYAFGYLTNNSYVAVSYNEEEPRIAFVPYEENYKDYLLYMKDLWDEGLMDPDMFTQTEAQVQTTCLDGTVGFCGMSAPYVYDPENQLDWRAMPSLIREEGQKAIYPATKPVDPVAYMVINANVDTEKAIALGKLGDAMFTCEWYIIATYGPEAGTDLDWNTTGHYVENNAVQYELLPESNGAWMHRTTFLSIWSLPGINSNEMRVEYAEKYPESQLGIFFNNGNIVTDWVVDCHWNETYADKYVQTLPALYFNDEDQERIAELLVPLQDYVAGCESKFITGEMSIENDFDTFVETLESYGVQELVEIYNRYYDSYKAN